MQTGPAKTPDGVLRGAFPCSPHRALARFDRRYQTRVRGLAMRHAYLADLAISFPALLFAMAVPRSGFDSAPVIAAAIEGASLASMAEAWGLPLWSRALPPEAFTQAIPPLPGGPLVQRHIVNHIPALAKELPDWLAAVGEAFAAGDERVAVWIAGEKKRDPKGVRLPTIRRTCLWAWHAKRGLTAPHLDRQWQPSMRYATADATARMWLAAVDIHLHARAEYYKNVWFEPATVCGFAFVPLTSPAEFSEEAEAMDNCLASYARNLEDNNAVVWSVRTAAGRIATLELRRDACSRTYVYQLCAKSNAAPAPEVVAAVAAWIDHAVPRTAPLEAEAVKGFNEQSAWTALWRAYWLDKRRIPAWLPIRVSDHALDNLRFAY